MREQNARDYTQSDPGNPAWRPAGHAAPLQGWTRESGWLRDLLDSLGRGDSVLLLGESGCGKTALLGAVGDILLHEEPAGPVPVPVDPAAASGQDSAPDLDSAIFHMVHALALALARARAAGREWIPAPLELPSVEGDFLSFGPDVGESFLRAGRTCADVLEEVDAALQSLNRRAVFLLDDIDRLAGRFRETRDASAFFGTLRRLQDAQPGRRGGVSFLAAARKEPEEFLEHSAHDFNLFCTVCVPPLSPSAFAGLWAQLGAEYGAHPATRRQGPGDWRWQNAERVCAMCGGNPGLARLLARQWAGDETVVLASHFGGLLDRQPEGSRRVLLALARGLAVDPLDGHGQRLKKLSLVCDHPDPGHGGIVLQGSLWADFLQEEVARIPATRKFADAGEFACAVLDGNLLSILLLSRAGKGEVSDWLEFKTALKLAGSKAKTGAGKKNMGRDDFVWNVVKPLVAMRNSRGGLICLGVDDSGRVTGLENVRKLAEVDFLRTNVQAHLERTDLVLCDQKKIHLDNYNLGNLLTSRAVRMQACLVNGHMIVAIAVRPIANMELEKTISVLETPTRTDTGEREYMLVRQHGMNKKLVRVQERLDFIKTPKPCDDLEALWQELSGGGHG